MDSTPGLTELLLRRESLILMVACWIFLDLVYRILPKAVRDAPITVRLAPVYPLIVCEAGIWCPGFFADIFGIEKALTGLILGWASAHVYKIFMQSVLGRDRRVNPHDGPDDDGEAEAIAQMERDAQRARRETTKLPPLGDE